VGRTRSVVGIVSTLVVLGAVTGPIQAVARSDSARHAGQHHSHSSHHGRHSHAKAHKATVLLHKAVGRPGVYSVRIAITWPAVARHGAVKLKIGVHAHRARTRGPGRATVVKATVHVHGRVLTIDETRLHGRPTLRIEVKRIGALRPTVKVTKPKPVAPAPSTAGTSGSSTSSASTTTPVPTGVAGSWHLIFDDEFNGSSLNPQYWSTGWFGSGITGGVGGASEPECYDPSHVVEANGELDLNFTQETESCDNGSHPYTSGMVTTNGKFSFTYGLIEFRVWLPTTSNGQVADWPDVWTDGQSWPADGEIDVAEGLGGNICAHYHGPTNNGAGTGAGSGDTGCPHGTYTGGWHTFAADWEPGIITYYYDGQDIGCLETSGSACGPANETIAGAPMYIILSLGSAANGTITAPTNLRVDYVRVWQH